jgi:hypothetical protein
MRLGEGTPMMGSKTIFGDFRQLASAVYRVTTESSVYIVGFHKEHGRTFVVVRGLPGTDREHVVLRDSDPRIGEASMFELSPAAWVGKSMRVATMTSSTIIAAAMETDRSVVALVGGDEASAQVSWMRASPRPAVPAVAPARAVANQPAMAPVSARGTQPGAAPPGIAYKVVVGQQIQNAPTVAGNASTPAAEPEVPYPLRHVMYAEHVAMFLRSIARRDRLFDDVAGDRELKARLTRSLDECADLLELIRRRNRR